MDLKDISWDQEEPLGHIIAFGAKPLQAYAKILEDEINDYFYDPEDQDKTNTLLTITLDIERIAKELEKTLERLNDEGHDKFKPKSTTNIKNKEDPGPPIDIDQLTEDLGFVTGVIQMVRDMEDIQHLNVPWVIGEAEKKLKNVKRMVFEPFGFKVA